MEKEKIKLARMNWLAGWVLAGDVAERAMNKPYKYFISSSRYIHSDSFIFFYIPINLAFVPFMVDFPNCSSSSTPPESVAAAATRDE